MIGVSTIPAYIRIANDQEMLEMALVENIQRKDLDPIEVALSFQRLIEEIKLTQEEMSERVGKKRSTVTNYLRLLKLDPIVQTGMRDAMISMGHGRALVNVEDKIVQLTVYENIIEEKLSVRQTEELIRNIREESTATKNTKTKKRSLPSFVNEGIQTFSKFFGEKIEVKISEKNKGKLVIPFNSEEDFNRLKKLLEQQG
jgi:ParB family chromosome partitioning protein